MSNNHFLFLCLFFVLYGCEYTNQQKQEPIQEIDTIIDFSTIDAFPLFPECSDIPSREKQQICFQLQMSQYIFAAIKNEKLYTSDSIQDTILLKLLVDNSGKTLLKDLKISPRIATTFPDIKKFIQLAIDTLPKLTPAVKRGIPVSTVYTLPIVIEN